MPATAVQANTDLVQLGYIRVLLERLAERTGFAFRFYDTENQLVAETAAQAPTCLRLHACLAGRRHCADAFTACAGGFTASGDSADDEARVNCCVGEVANISIPVRVRGYFLGQLVCVTPFLPASPDERRAAEARLRQLAGQLGIPAEELLELYRRSTSISRGKLEAIRLMVPHVSIDEVIKLIGDSVVSRFIDLVLPETKSLRPDKFWSDTAENVRLIAAVEEVEVFTVAPARDALVRVWPAAAGWEGVPTAADLHRAEEAGAARDEQGRVLVPVRSRQKLLAVFRVRLCQGNPNVEADLRHLTEYAEATATSLLAMRGRLIEEALGRLNPLLARTRDHKERLRILLAECARLLGCEHGDIALRKFDAPGWLKVTTRHGPVARNLPYQVPGDRGINGRLFRTGEPAVVPVMSQDPDYLALVNAQELRDRYRDADWNAYQDFLRRLQACVKFPLKVFDEILGILCVHRLTPGPFDLDYVHVVEHLVEQFAAAEAACVLVAEEDSLRVLRARAAAELPEEDLLSHVAGLNPAEARHRLFQELVDKVLVDDAAYRVALCMVNPNWTSLTVVARSERDAGSWPEDFEKTIPLTEPDSACVVAFLDGKTYAIEDTAQKDIHFLRVPPDRTGSTVAIPLRSGTHTLGVLSVEWETTGAFDGLLLQKLERLAERYAGAIKTFDVDQLFDHLEKQLLESEGAEPDYPAILRTVSQMLGAFQGAILLRHAGTGRYHIKASLLHPEHAGAADQWYEPGEGVTGWVIEHNKAVRIANLADDEELRAIDPKLKWRNKVDDNESYLNKPCSFLGVPIAVGNEVLGVLRLGTALRQRFSVYDEQVALAAASRLAGYLYERTKRARTEALMRLSSLMLRAESLTEIRAAIFDTLQRVLGECDCIIRVVDNVQESGGALSVALWRLADNKPAWMTGPVLRRMGEGIAGWVWENDRAFIDPDITRPESLCQTAALREALHPEFYHKVRTVVCVPMRVDNQCFGTLYLHKQYAKAFSLPDITCIETVAGVAGPGLRAVYEREDQRLELKLEKAADNFLIGLLRGKDMASQQEAMFREVLGALVDGLRASCGWARQFDDREDRFVALHAIGVPLADVPLMPAEDVRRLLGAKGFRVALYEADDLEVAELSQRWAESYRQRFDGLHWCMIALYADGGPAATFVLLSRELEALSYRSVEMAQTTLQRIGVLIDIGRRFEDQQRDTRVAFPLALRGSLISSFEHRILGPIRKIRMAIDFVMSRQRTPEQERLRQALMEDEYQKLETYVAELHSLGDLRKDSFVEVDVAATLQAASDEVLAKFQANRDGHHSQAAALALRRQFSPHRGTIRGEAKYLQEAFQFVIENALQAAADRPEGNGVVRLETKSTAESCVVLVEDNGPGMETAVSDQAFNMFFTTKPKGLGIGLPTAYFIVRSHGGRFRLESSKGVGTKVTITFPLYQGAR
jgi:signal transduction histidine kinase/GAF domain-containing protein